MKRREEWLALLLPAWPNCCIIAGRLYDKQSVRVDMSALEPEARSIDQPDLLRAKLRRPRVTHDLVVRPRLLELLDRGLDGRLTLVSAPGFGKTTLISSWLEGMAAARADGPAPLPAAWLSLDRQDGDLGLFSTPSYIYLHPGLHLPGGCGFIGVVLSSTCHDHLRQASFQL